MTSGLETHGAIRRFGEARAEGDNALDGEHDYDVPTFLRKQAD